MPVRVGDKIKQVGSGTYPLIEVEDLDPTVGAVADGELLKRVGSEIDGEAATATPGANVIPRAGAGGKLADGFIPDALMRDAEHGTDPHTMTIDGRDVSADGATLDALAAKVRFSYSITVENPSNAEDITVGFTNRAITVTEMRAVLIGSLTPSVTWTVRHATDRSLAGSEVVTGGTTTISTTFGSDVTTFNNPNILLDSFIWLKTTAKSGTVGELHVTIIGTIN